MSKQLSMNELLKLNEKDLLSEIHVQRRTVRKMSLALKLGKDKDAHNLQAAKKMLARMLTVLVQLRSSQKPSTLPAPASKGESSSVS